MLKRSIYISILFLIACANLFAQEPFCFGYVNTYSNTTEGRHTQPRSADFNGDGYKDIVFNNYKNIGSGFQQNNIIIYKVDTTVAYTASDAAFTTLSKLTFTTAITSGLSIDPSDIAVGDFNNDLNPDCAVLIDNRIYILNGSANGILSAPSTILTFSNTYTVQHYTSTTSYYDYSDKSHYNNIEVFDYNKDTINDLVVFHNTNDYRGMFVEMSVFKGTGGGSFDPIPQKKYPFHPAKVSTINNKKYFTIADLDNDNDPDIILTVNKYAPIISNPNTFSEKICILENITPVSSPTYTYNTYTPSLSLIGGTNGKSSVFSTVGYINNDTQLDVIISHITYSTTPIYSYFLYINAFPNLYPPTLITSGLNNHNFPPILKDMNADTKLDIVSILNNGNVFIQPGNSTLNYFNLNSADHYTVSSGYQPEYLLIDSFDIRANVRPGIFLLNDFSNAPNNNIKYIANHPNVIRLLGPDRACPNSNTTIYYASAYTTPDTVWFFTAITNSVSEIGIFNQTVMNGLGGNNTCTYTASKTVITQTVPMVAINVTPTTTVCSGSPFTFTTITNPNYSFTLTTSSSSQTFIPPYSTSITNSSSSVIDKIYTLSVKDGTNVCIGTSSVTVRINPAINFSITATPSKTICAGTTVTLNAININTVIPIISYTWVTIGNTGSSINYSPTSDITYTVIATASNNCIGSATANIMVNLNPTITINPSYKKVCEGESIVLNAININTAIPISNYSWQPIGNLGSSSNYSPTSDNTYTVIATASNNCIVSATATITIAKGDDVQLTANPSTICANINSTLTAINGTVASWALVNKTDSVVKPIQTTKYDVLITDNNGCVFSKSVTVIFNTNCLVTPYTGFTPNGDGINDFFYIQGIDGFSNNTVSIYNRWGVAIFETVGYNNSTNYWDGTSHEKTVTAGTYFYVVKLNNEKDIIKGWVEVTTK